MKANEALKSKFVYPDKMYARCKDNKTLDISYAPQTLKAVEYTRTDAFIDKACEWLEYHANDFMMTSHETLEDWRERKKILFNNFRKTMEE